MPALSRVRIPNPPTPRSNATAEAAKALNDQRENWLNPIAWVAEVAEQVDAADDIAVLAAYAHTDPAANWSPAWAEVFEDTGAGQPLPPAHPLAPRRAEVEQLILVDLLHLNHERA